MPPFVRRYASTAVAFMLTFVIALFLLARLAAADIDAGQLAPAVTASDPVVASDHAPAAPDFTAAEPTSIKVPAPSSDPGGAIDVVKETRKLGGLWLAIVVVVFAFAAEARKRTAPKEGDAKPDPRSWRARSYALACAVAVMLATLIDVKVGGVGWSALAVPGAFAVGRVMDAIDPPKGSKKPDESKA